MGNNGQSLRAVQEKVLEYLHVLGGKPSIRNGKGSSESGVEDSGTNKTYDFNSPP